MTQRPAAGERTVNGIRPLVVRRSGRGVRPGADPGSGEVALDGDDARGGTAADDVADEGLALGQLLVAGLGELLDDLDRAGRVEVEARSRSSMSAGSTGPWVHSRAARRGRAAGRGAGGALVGRASNPSSDSPLRVRIRRPAATAYGSTVLTHRSEGELTRRRTP